MIRKTLTIFSLIGLLLSVVLWGVSYFHVMYYTQHEVLISLSPGALQLTCDGLDWIDVTYWHLPRIQINNRVTNVILPLWMPTILFAFLSSFPLRTFHRRRKRKKLGLCLKCGYDIRGSKERCPECGQEFETT